MILTTGTAHPRVLEARTRDPVLLSGKAAPDSRRQDNGIGLAYGRTWL
jgi:hypothetical protein